MDGKSNASRLTRAVGSLLTIAALIFVGRSVWLQKEFIASISIETTLTILLAGIPVYMLANIVLVTAWEMLLNWFGETRLGFFTGMWIYGKTQVLKYIPGNLLYLPGRHLLSQQRGAGHAALAGAAAFEVIGLLASASSISILGIVFTRGVNPASLFAAAAALAISFASPLILRYASSIEFVSKKIPAIQKISWGTYPRLLAIWSLYIFFFMLIGSTLFWTTNLVAGRWNVAPAYIAFFTFTISWFLGTITPGAPAGAGIRESIIILMMSPYVGESNSVLVSLMMRIITMLGDAAFYFLSLYLERKFP